MKMFDKVKILVSNPEYEKYGVYKDMVGTIVEAHIEFRSFQVAFTDPTPFSEETMYSIKDDIVEYIHVKIWKLSKRAIAQMNSYLTICQIKIFAGIAKLKTALSKICEAKN